MTKVRDLTRPNGEEKKLKPIEFVKEYRDKNSDGNCWNLNPTQKTIFWKNIELIARGFDGDLDLMFAFDSNRSYGYLYLGYFNDGYV